MTKAKKIHIGIAFNSANQSEGASVKDQYVTSQEMFAEISETLSNLGAKVSRFEASNDFLGQLQQTWGDIDLIFNLANDIYQVAVPMAVEQICKEKGARNLVCTGSKVEGHVLALNKVLARRVLSNRVVQPKWCALDEITSPQADLIDFPALVKPINEGQSIGIRQSNVVSSMNELNDVLTSLRSELGGTMLIESFLDGVEYSIGLVGNVVMPAISWDLDRLPGKPLVRGEDLKQGNLTIPHASLVEDLTIMDALAKQVITAQLELGLQDYSRSDFRAKRSDQTPHYLETNSGPGLQNIHSVLPWTAAGAGVSYENLIGAIIAQALKRLPIERQKELDTRGFEKAYENLIALGKTGRSIQLAGREFYILKPLNNN